MVQRTSSTRLAGIRRQVSTSRARTAGMRRAPHCRTCPLWSHRTLLGLLYQLQCRRAGTDLRSSCCTRSSSEAAEPQTPIHPARPHNRAHTCARSRTVPQCAAVTPRMSEALGMVDRAAGLGIDVARGVAMSVSRAERLALRVGVTRSERFALPSSAYKTRRCREYPWRCTRKVPTLPEAATGRPCTSCKTRVRGR